MLGEIDLWRRLAEAIAGEIDSRCDGIVSGKLDGMERYRFETGFVRGLQWVLDRARDLTDAAARPEPDDPTTNAHSTNAPPSTNALEDEDAG
jgi:hypothetical protein